MHEGGKMENLEAGAAIPAGEGRDNWGRIETRGIDMIPEVERRAKPFTLFSVFFGPQFGYGNMLFGALPIAFGLGWWAAFASITVGTAIGSLVFLGISPLSPRTGTNTQVSSGIAFGTRGRLLGSGITWFIAIGFFIILIYTSGQAIDETFNRWAGTPTGLGALSVSMIVVLAIACLAAILGHGTLEKSIRGINIVSVIVLVMIIAVFASHFRVTHGSNYLLGSFWPTWFIATTTTASLPISWGPFVGDYGRYIPSNTPSWKVSGFAILGIFSGCYLAMIAAAFAATSFVAQAGNFVTGITQAAPAWLLLPLLLVPGLASNTASAAMSLYNATLDISAWPFFYRFKRWAITTGFAVILLGLTYLFVLATNFLTNLEAFVTIMIVTATPWMVIVGIEFTLSGRDLAPIDLHAFAIPGMRGKYWYANGVNPRAFVAWACGAGAGLLFSTNSLFTGPLESSVSGVDISWLVAAIVGGVVYLALRYFFRPVTEAAAIPEIGLAGSVASTE
jgi:purine-cytosine permease-like protein